MTVVMDREEAFRRGWIIGPNMWRAGFVLDSLELISRMSGLVDVLECVWEDNDNALVFIVKNTSGEMFKGEGGLCGVPVNGYRLPTQGLLVTATHPTRRQSLLS